MIYGAILGDIIGSRFEFDIGGKTKDFDLFTERNTFTDDTVMTIAIAEAMSNLDKDASPLDVMDECTRSMQKWGFKYPNAGYGQMFVRWFRNPVPYGSYGNGSAMRVSSVGWKYDTLEKTIDVAGSTAMVSHDHPEGIKGAECTAAVIFLGRTGYTKGEIREWVAEHYDYDLTKTVDEWRLQHEHIESCMDSLPKALAAFFEGNDFEDVIRNAVSLGGDTDTLAAIAGAMAEGMYKIPQSMIDTGLSFLTEEMRSAIRDIDNKLVDRS